MPRTLPANILQALLAPQTGECLILLLTLTHPSLPAPIRVCNDGKDVISGGQRFIAFPFQIPPPDELDETVPRVQLRIDNVDQQIVTAIRTCVGEAPQVTLEVIAASDPDAVLLGPYRFRLRDARWNATTVEGELVYRDMLTEPWPAPLMTPSRLPGIFAY